MTTATPGISALQLQRQLGLSRYETAWMIFHKLRRAMVAPERSMKGSTPAQFARLVELDMRYNLDSTCRAANRGVDDLGWAQLRFGIPCVAMAGGSR